MPKLIQAIKWEDHRLIILDQRKLPGEELYIHVESLAQAAEAIRSLAVRGAPAIGVAAAYACVVAVRQQQPQSLAQAVQALGEACQILQATRPTAVNLAWALDQQQQRMQNFQQQHPNVNLDAWLNTLEQGAERIHQEDVQANLDIGRHGAELIQSGATILTICNAGQLATSGYGTALSAIYTAHEQGKAPKVFACETRPLLQGARITCWELQKAGVDVTLICDSMAAYVMQQGKVDMVMAGADRIAANGDSANKIGTYGLAVLADYHNIPFYILAPQSTIDHALSHGKAIPIVQRSADEVRYFSKQVTAPSTVPVFNPAFDVTPAGLIHGIVTQDGIWKCN